VVNDWTVLEKDISHNVILIARISSSGGLLNVEGKGGGGGRAGKGESGTTLKKKPRIEMHQTICDREN